MSESGGITVFSEGGVATESLAQVASDFLLIKAIISTLTVVPVQTGCLVNDLYDLMKNVTSESMGEIRKAFAVYPALAVAGIFTRSGIPKLSEIVRHGILVQTTDDETGRPIYFYIGGVSSEWINNRRLQGILVYQGGSRFTLQSGKFTELIQNSKYPIMVAPLKPPPGFDHDNFVNPPDTKCLSNLPSQILNSWQSSSIAWGTFIPNYVGVITGMLSKFKPYYYKSGNKWVINPSVASTIQAISSIPPLFFGGLAILPQIEQFGLGTIDINTTYVYDFTNINPPFVNFFLGDPFPLLNGAPAYTDMLCTGNCSGLGLAGFVVAPGGVMLPTEEIDVFQAQLIPPPKDFTFQGIMDYASQLGQYTWVDQLVNDIKKAFKVISILVTNFGWLEQEAEKAVYALEWFGSEFEKTAEEIAQDIVNEFSKPEHSESEHTDEAGMEVHKAYMCVRFGLCE